MREQLKGKKTYLFAAFAVALGIYGAWSGEMTLPESVGYVLNGGALGAVRGAIG